MGLLIIKPFMQLGLNKGEYMPAILAKSTGTAVFA